MRRWSGYSLGGALCLHVWVREFCGRRGGGCELYACEDIWLDITYVFAIQQAFQAVKPCTSGVGGRFRVIGMAR